MADAKQVISKEQDFKKQAVALAMDQIQKEYGKGSIMLLGDRPVVTMDVIPTNILPLDVALGIGGLPKGRIIEIYGPESSGKTTICLNLIAQVQKSGGTCAFIDAEHAMDPGWATKLGVDIDSLLISQPDSGEQGLEITETLVRSGGVDFIVVDSVAALVPKAELEGDMGDSVMGVQARLMSQALRKLTGILNKSKTTIVFTNQLRLKIGVMFGNPETTTGGMALKFYASVRMDVRKIETIKDDGVVVGSRHRVKVVKNKMAPPFKEAEFVINGNGVDIDEALVEAAINKGVFVKSGAFIKYNDKVIGQGKEAVKRTLQVDLELRESVLSALKPSVA
jgi:recombination protein RecA